MSIGWLTRAASQAEDGALGIFFMASWVAVAFGAGLVVGGVEEVDRPGLFGCRWIAVLPLSAFVPSPLVAPLARGHQCHFTVLHNANLHLHHWHFHCGVPLMASLATFQHSHLDAWFLFHASCFFSF
jgi:hypothetical protein